LKNKIKNGRGGEVEGPKIYKKRIKNHPREDIYNINNFIIHPNQIKITHAAKNSKSLNILTPTFKDVYALCDFDDGKSVNAFSFSSIEDTSDEAYNKYHDQYEMRERDYRKEIYGVCEKKKKKENSLKHNVHPQGNLDTTVTDSSEGGFKIRIEIDNSKNNFE
jgi:5S rRNA maturation endonuclease (ribonuclease M5)